MKDFQLHHFDNRERIENLRHDSKACWVTLAVLVLDETEHMTSNTFPLESFLEIRLGVG
jgi:hypothetical protein